MRLSKLEQETASYRKINSLSEVVTKELNTLFPNILSVAIGQSIRNYTDNQTPDTICQVHLNTKGKLAAIDYQRITSWLQTRLETQQLEVIE